MSNRYYNLSDDLLRQLQIKRFAPVMHVEHTELDPYALTKTELEIEDMQPIFNKTSLEKEHSTIFVRFGRGDGHKPLKNDVQVISNAINYGGGFVKVVVEWSELERITRDPRRSTPKRLDPKERKRVSNLQKEGELLENTLLFTFLYDKEAEMWLFNNPSFDEELLEWEEEKKEFLHAIETNYFRYMREVGLKQTPRKAFTFPDHLMQQIDISMKKKKEQKQREEMEQRGIYTAEFASFLRFCTNSQLYTYLEQRKEELELIRMYHYLLTIVGKLEEKPFELLCDELEVLHTFYDVYIDRIISMTETEREEEAVFDREKEQDLLDRLFRPGYYVLNYQTNPVFYPNVRSIYDSYQEQVVSLEQKRDFDKLLQEQMRKEILALKSRRQSEAIKDKVEYTEFSDIDYLVHIDKIVPAVLKDLKKKA